MRRFATISCAAAGVRRGDGLAEPAALWALPLALLPVLIHLLRTHHARRVQFPSLRFVQPSRTAAVRMRLPSDLLLMTLRVAVVGLAVAAIAGPSS